MNSDTSPQAGGTIQASGLSEQEAPPPLITTPAVEAQRAGAALHSETRVPLQLREGAEGTFTWGAYFQAIGILIALLALLWLVLRLIRKVGAGRFLPANGGFTRRDLRLEAQLPLGRNRSLYVVRYLGKRLLLGVTEQRITLLDLDGTDDTEGDVPHDERKISDFRQLLEQASAEGSSGASGGAAASGTGAGGSGR